MYGGDSVCVEGDCVWRGLCVEGTVYGGDSVWRGLYGGDSVCVEGTVFVEGTVCV